MKRNLHLLVIDPQNDFCDVMQRPTGGRARQHRLAGAGFHPSSNRVGTARLRAPLRLFQGGGGLIGRHRLDAHSSVGRRSHRR